MLFSMNVFLIARSEFILVIVELCDFFANWGILLWIYWIESPRIKSQLNSVVIKDETMTNTLLYFRVGSKWFFHSKQFKCLLHRLWESYWNSICFIRWSFIIFIHESFYYQQFCPFSYFFSLINWRNIAKRNFIWSLVVVCRKRVLFWSSIFKK